MKITETTNGFGLYLNKEVQSHTVFDYLLDQCNGADKMIVSSFAITEAYVRRIIRNRQRIEDLTLFLDFTIASRNPRGTNYAAHNVDRLYLTNNHSKFIYISRSGVEYLSIMSNNATNNHRYESGIILSDSVFIAEFLAQIEAMKLNCVLYGS
ncbi:MAG: hypothetical protein HQ522_07805 [Bacteroidetes bacterium]|nr:hypothetical protein [Bacteroidota bacterium]